MTDTELCENGVDRSKLNPCATTLISQILRRRCGPAYQASRVGEHSTR